jgi:TonB family protein
MHRLLLILAMLPAAALASWIVDESSGCSIFVEFAAMNEKSRWSGACENGKAQGSGVLTSSNGTRIEGDYRDGQPFNARGREPIVVLGNGRRLMAMVTYTSGFATRYGTEPRPSSEDSASYAARIAAAVRMNLVHSSSIAGNPVAVVDVRVDEAGRILSVTLISSSGVLSWDEAVLKAIDKTGVLPLDGGKIPPRLELAFRPD